MLNYLYHLQELETAERAIVAERMNSTEFKDLRSLKSAFDTKKRQYLRINQDVSALEEELSAMKTQRPQLLLKIDEEKAAMYDGSVTGTKSFAARETQIKSLEDKLEDLRLRQEKREAELRQKSSVSSALKQELAEQYRLFNNIKNAYQSAQKIRDQRLSELGAQKASLLVKITGDELRWFEQQRDKFGGTPVARLDENHVCRGCRTVVPPITYKRTLQGQRTFCEKCGRILFIEESN